MGDTSLRSTDDSSYKPEDPSPSQSDPREDGQPGADPRGRYSQQSNLQIGYAQGQQYPPQQQPSQTRPEAFNLGSLNTALPDPSYQNYGPLPQRYAPAPSPSGPVYQMQNNTQYAAYHIPNPANVPYPYQAQYQGGYVTSSAGSQAAIGKQPYHQGFVQQQQPFGSPYYIQPSQYSHPNQIYPGMHQPAQYGVRGNRSGENRIPPQQRTNDYLGPVRSSSTGESWVS